MKSDLDQNPVKALELYCARTRVEIMFDYTAKSLS